MGLPPSACRTCLAVLTLAALTSSGRAADSPTADHSFFEQKIRPVLVEHCYKCHSGKAAKGGLLLDSRPALLRGGDSGPALVPGKPDVSLLIKAMRWTDEGMRMPPKGKLPELVVADFTRWIAAGAADPRQPAALARPEVDPAAVGKHWAFQPISRPAVPALRESDRARTPIDRFILAKLQTRGLSLSREADRRTLLRRLSLDLTGLPPTLDDLNAFVADPRPDAYERIVDRLLASPAYGERWGRHWLDVARYADTKDGVLQYGDDRIRPYAYTYRDYVLRAFNRDLPFDRFVHEQLAADQLDAAGEPWRLGALGFLTLGRQFDNNVHDVLDDRIDTVTRGLLGLTVTCARCHDHKSDPVPMADYYSLYGVFASSEAPIELPAIAPLTAVPEAATFEQKAVAKRKEVRELLDREYTRQLETARQRVGDYLIRAATTKPDPLETAIFFLSLAPEDLRPQIVASWRRLLERRARPGDPVFGPWHDLLAVPEAKLAAELAGLRERWRRLPAGTAAGQLNPRVWTLLEKANPVSHADVARAYGELIRTTYETARKTPVTPGSPEAQLVDLLTATDSPGYFPRSRTRDFMSRGDKDAFGGKMQELDRLAVQSRHAPPRAMVLVDAEQPYEPQVFVRGDPSRPGPRVPRQFLRVVAGEKRQPFHRGSGRLDLAEAITAPDNPLTARVLVNRVWMHHFREPLVDSPSDFGLRTAPPSHPALLDFLARDLIDGGWSLKRLHRQLLLSSVYRQGSDDRPDCRSVDPDNRLLWRMNRRRLDLEAMRDALLSVSGRLDRQMHGRPVDVANNPAEQRRTVYGLVDRQSLPGVFRAFDFASPDTSAERRPQTTVPQQALFGLNAPFMLEQARGVAARVGDDPTGGPEARVERLYRLILSREPGAAERDQAARFLVAAEKGNAGSTLSPVGQLAQVLLLTNEFLFVD